MPGNRERASPRPTGVAHSKQSLIKKLGKRFGGPGVFLAVGMLRLMSATYRVEIVGEEHLLALVAKPRPVILSFWHNRSVLGYFLYQYLHRQGLALTILASQSRDGGLVARIARAWGLHLVRGSASRGGREAIRRLYRSITADHSSPIVIPDGPRGPRYEAKLGAVILAQLTQAPILPLSLAPRHGWRLASWDRMIVPIPFARVVVTVGPPLNVPRKLDEAGKEQERRRLETCLNELGETAESRVQGRGTIPAKP